MADVPTYDNLRQGLNGGTGARFQAPDAPSAAAIGARQIQQAGETGMAVGGAANRVALDMQAEADEVRVLDAVNQAKERVYDLTYGKDGYANAKGFNALQRPDGKTLHDEYAGKFDEVSSAITASLSTERQRLAFGKAAAGMRLELYGGAQRHVSGEFRNYQESVFNGGIQNAQRSIAMGYADPDTVAKGVASIQADTRAKARLLGLSQEFADVEVRKAVSNAHVLALGAALEKNDVTFADAYLKKHAGEMEADDLLRVQGHITKEMRQHQVTAAIDTVWKDARPQVTPTDMDRAWGILKGTESRGRQFGMDGKPLTSKAGAVGVAQVMEATGPEAAKLAGEKWDRDRWLNDAAYNEKIGRAYFQKQLQDFGGRLDLAYAAYNAGPGAVRKAMEKAVSHRGGVGNWLDYVPAETQAYVRKNMGEFNAGGGKPAPLDPTALADAVVARIPNATPEQRQAALAEVTRRITAVRQAEKERGDQATAGAMQKILASGGDMSVITATERAAIPGDDLPRLLSFATTLAKKEDVQTNLAVYARLSDPEQLRTMGEADLYKLRMQLSDSDFKHFVNERQKLVNPKPGAADTPGDLNSAAIKSTLDDRLRSLGMDPTPKDGSGDAERVGAIRQHINTSILMAQKASGKKFSDAEVVAFIDGQFARSTEFKGFFSSTKAPTLSAKVGDIPSADRDAIKAAFKRQGIDKPSDGEILRVWFMSQNQRQGGAQGSY